MLFVDHLHRFVAFVCCTVCAVASTATAWSVEADSRVVTAPITLNEQAMIIVSVRVNGAGPYDFMLDTGCAKTIVDRKLVRELHLQQIGEKTVIGVIDSTKMLVTHIDSISVNGATVQGGEVLSTDHASSVGGKVRGVLGEDFLRNFDLLIDYRHKLIRLERASGSMAESALGEHLLLELAPADRAVPTHNRLFVPVHIAEFGEEAIFLLLDSGTNQLTLFRDSLGPGENAAEPIRTASFSHWLTLSTPARRIRTLNLGSRSVSDVTAIALPRQAGSDSDGLLPTSLFQSVFICHLGGFVILNPTFPKSETTP